MKQIISEIFPTEILCCDNVLSIVDSNVIEKSIYNNNITTSNKQNTLVQSGHNLHEENEFKPLVDKVVQSVKNYINHKQWICDDFKISGMWSNIQKSGEYFKPHNHANNILSGVYYVKSDSTSQIIFMDPRPQMSVLKPSNKIETRTNSDRWFYPSVQNRLLLFPSWLNHYVDTNHSSDDRISVAFNIMLSGTIGDPRYFQSAEF